MGLTTGQSKLPDDPYASPRSRVPAANQKPLNSPSLGRTVFEKVRCVNSNAAADGPI